MSVQDTSLVALLERVRKVLTVVDEQVNEVIISAFDMLNEVEQAAKRFATPEPARTWSDLLNDVWSDITADVESEQREDFAKQTEDKYRASQFFDGYDFDWMDRPR